MVRDFIEQWRAACAPKPSYKFDLVIENPDGSQTELRGLSVQSIDYGLTVPSTYARSGRDVFITGPNAESHDLPRAEAWAKEHGIDMLPYSCATSVDLYFETEHDAVLAMLALA